MKNKAYLFIAGLFLFLTVSCSGAYNFGSGRISVKLPADTVNKLNAKNADDDIEEPDDFQDIDYTYRFVLSVSGDYADSKSVSFHSMDSAKDISLSIDNIPAGSKLTVKAQVYAYNKLLYEGNAKAVVKPGNNKVNLYLKFTAPEFEDPRKLNTGFVLKNQSKRLTVVPGQSDITDELNFDDNCKIDFGFCNNTNYFSLDYYGDCYENYYNESTKSVSSDKISNLSNVSVIASSINNNFIACYSNSTNIITCGEVINGQARDFREEFTINYTKEDYETVQKLAFSYADGVESSPTYNNCRFKYYAAGISNQGNTYVKLFALDEDNTDKNQKIENYYLFCQTDNLNDYFKIPPYPENMDICVIKDMCIIGNQLFVLVSVNPNYPKTAYMNGGLFVIDLENPEIVRLIGKSSDYYTYTASINRERWDYDTTPPSIYFEFENATGKVYGNKSGKANKFFCPQYIAAIREEDIYICDSGYILSEYEFGKDEEMISDLFYYKKEKKNRLLKVNLKTFAIDVVNEDLPFDVELPSLGCFFLN